MCSIEHSSVEHILRSNWWSLIPCLVIQAAVSFVSSKCLNALFLHCKRRTCRYMLFAPKSKNLFLRAIFDSTHLFRPRDQNGLKGFPTFMEHFFLMVGQHFFHFCPLAFVSAPSFFRRFRNRQCWFFFLPSNTSSILHARKLIIF